MIIDKGLSIAETRSLVEMDAAYFEFLKLSFGTAVLYDPAVLMNKIHLAAEYDIQVYPGGTFFEVAFSQDKTDVYLEKMAELNFKWVEISDGTIEIPAHERELAIKKSISMGFDVITEVGKKDAANQPDIATLVEAALLDLNHGARFVIIEARESGHGIGIYDQQGKVLEQKFAVLKRDLPVESLIWEAPLKNQQAQLINEFGPNVNLGNVPPGDAMALEALRLGLRSDTWPVKLCTKLTHCTN